MVPNGILVIFDMRPNPAYAALCFLLLCGAQWKFMSSKLWGKIPGDFKDKKNFHHPLGSIACSALMWFGAYRLGFIL